MSSEMVEEDKALSAIEGTLAFMLSNLGNHWRVLSKIVT